MISLARHIEILLLEHDCVIVPGFGGFIANHSEAKYNDACDALFLPPYRTIGFNHQLNVNDGLLVQSYMAAYDASYPAAYLQMEKDVENLMAELDTVGVVELEGIGTLTKSISNNISFTSQESGITTPSLYGLYSFEIKSLEQATREREIEEALQSASNMQTPIGINALEEEEKKDVVIRLRRRWIDIAISAAAAIILFFGISYPTLNNNTPEGDTCVATVCNVKDKPAVKHNHSTIIKETKVSENKDKKPITLQEGTSKREDTKVLNSNIQDAESKYSIVLASYVSEANANEFIGKLNEKGYSEGRFVKKGKVSRILYSGFSTESEARTKLTELRKATEEFAEAWVIAL